VEGEVPVFLIVRLSAVFLIVRLSDVFDVKLEIWEQNRSAERELLSRGSEKSVWVSLFSRVEEEILVDDQMQLRRECCEGGFGCHDFCALTLE